MGHEATMFGISSPCHSLAGGRSALADGRSALANGRAVPPGGLSNLLLTNP